MKKHEKTKLFLLHSILEKNEACIIKDEHGNENATVVGSFDSMVTKKVAILCHNSVKRNSIGPKTQKLSNKNFLKSPQKLKKVILDISVLRKYDNPTFLTDYNKMKKILML